MFCLLYYCAVYHNQSMERKIYKNGKYSISKVLDADIRHLAEFVVTGINPSTAI